MGVALDCDGLQWHRASPVPTQPAQRDGKDQHKDEARNCLGSLHTVLLAAPFLTRSASSWASRQMSPAPMTITASPASAVAARTASLTVSGTSVRVDAITTGTPSLLASSAI